MSGYIITIIHQVKWKDKFAYTATYGAFIEALLASGMTQAAVEASKIIREALSD